MGIVKSCKRNGQMRYAITSMAYHPNCAWYICKSMYCAHPFAYSEALTQPSGLSWSFQTSLCAAPRTIGEGYRWFAQNIKVAHTFRPWSSKSGSTLAFDFPSSLKLRGFIQKTIWHFCLACDSRCTLDVIKADRFDTAAARPGFPTKLLESQWGVEVYHDRWGMLSRGLPRGKPSSLKIDDIFPDSSKANDIDPSLGGFVDTMRQIVDTLYHSQLV